MAFQGKVPRDESPAAEFTLLTTDLKNFSARLTSLDNKLLLLDNTIIDLSKIISELSIAIQQPQGGGGGGVLTPAELLLLRYSSSFFQDKGIATGGGNNVLIDAVKNWPQALWPGSLLVMSINGQIYIRIISTNDSNSLTIGVLPGNVNVLPGTPYFIKAAPETGVKLTTLVINLLVIAAAGISTLAQCVAIDLGAIPATMAITVEVTYNAAAVAGIRAHVRSSYDNLVYDTVDWDTFNPSFVAGTTIRQTRNYAVNPFGAKVLIENLDLAQTVTNVKVYVTVGA